MSAKDRRKSLALRLDPLTYAALGAYRRAHGARSLSEAARRCLRGALGLTADRPADRPTAPGPKAARPLRLQLEPALVRALFPDPTDARQDSAQAVADRLRARLGALGFRVAHESTPDDAPEKS